MREPTGTERRVCDLIAQRQSLGLNKYGTTVAENPLTLRQWLVHQQEELLDAANHLAGTLVAQQEAQP